MKRLTVENFIERAITVHCQKYNYKLVKYVNAHVKVKIICKIHGEFQQTPNKHIRGQNCPKCIGFQKLTTGQFIEKAIIVHGNIYDYKLVNYVNIHKKIKIICKIHGIFQQEANSHLYGSGCPKCNKRTMTDGNFIIKSSNLHNNKYDYTLIKYKGSQIKVKIICPEHGVFEQTPNSHLSGRGCPKCSHQVSKPELEICSFLDELNIEYEQSNRSILNGKELDIVIPSKKIAIEFNGKYQHSDDMIKKKYNYFYTANEYHQMKTDMCNDIGYNLLHIFEEDQIKDKQKQLDRIKIFIKKVK